MNIPKGATLKAELKDGEIAYLKQENDIWFIFCSESGKWITTHVPMDMTNSQIKELIPIKDPVNHPTHYTQGKVECIDAIESATVGKNGIEAVCVGNVIKYLWRYEQKGGKESVEKAQYYLNKLLEKME